MENFYQKPEMEGRGSSETTANFYKKPPKIWKISTRDLKWREETSSKCWYKSDNEIVDSK